VSSKSSRNGLHVLKRALLAAMHVPCAGDVEGARAVDRDEAEDVGVEGKRARQAPAEHGDVVQRRQRQPAYGSALRRLHSRRVHHLSLYPFHKREQRRFRVRGTCARPRPARLAGARLLYKYNTHHCSLLCRYGNVMSRPARDSY
jgi:hypothetical protein